MSYSEKYDKSDRGNRNNQKTGANISDTDLKKIITDANGTSTLVQQAKALGKLLKDQGLSTSQIRSLFGEVRQIQGEWSITGHEKQALSRLILLKPKMAYRARKERGDAVRTLVEVLEPALDLVVNTGSANISTQKENFQRFVDFFEAILAYHKAAGGN